MFIIRVSHCAVEANKPRRAAPPDPTITVDERMPSGEERRIGWFYALDLSSCGRVHLVARVDGAAVWIEAERMPSEIPASAPAQAVL